MELPSWQLFFGMKKNSFSIDVDCSLDYWLQDIQGYRPGELAVINFIGNHCISRYFDYLCKRDLNFNNSKL